MVLRGINSTADAHPTGLLWNGTVPKMAWGFLVSALIAYTCIIEAEVTAGRHSDSQPAASRSRQHALLNGVSNGVNPPPIPPSPASSPSSTSHQPAAAAAMDCKSLVNLAKQQYGTRFLQVRQVDEQMTNGILALRSVLALAATTNRTCVEPLVASADMRSLFHTPCGSGGSGSNKTGGGGGGGERIITGSTAASLGTVFDVPRLEASGGVRIIPFATVSQLAACGAWHTPAAAGGPPGQHTQQRCIDCRRPEGQESGRCEASSSNSKPGSVGWYDDAARVGPNLLELCCVQRLGRWPYGKDHFIQEFGYNKKKRPHGYNVDKLKIQFSPSLLSVADAFLLRTGLLASGSGGYVGIHWRSEAMWKTHGKQSAGPSILRGAAAAIIQNVKQIQAACGIRRAFLAVDFSDHGSTSISYTEDVRQALSAAYTSIVAALDAEVFDPEKDFESAVASHNSMGVAAAEMTILARSTEFYPAVQGGQFVLKVADEHRKPELVGQADTLGPETPPKCRAVLQSSGGGGSRRGGGDDEKKATKKCKKRFGERAPCPVLALVPVGLG